VIGGERVDDGPEGPSGPATWPSASHLDRQPAERHGVGLGKGTPVELQEVVGAADELPLRVGRWLASPHERADPAGVLDLAEDRLDDRLAPLVERASLRVRHLAVHASPRRSCRFSVGRTYSATRHFYSSSIIHVRENPGWLLHSLLHEHLFVDGFTERHLDQLNEVIAV